MTGGYRRGMMQMVVGVGQWDSGTVKCLLLILVDILLSFS